MFILNPYSKNSIRKHLVAYYPLNGDYDDMISPPCNLLNSVGTTYFSVGVIGQALFCPPNTNSCPRDNANRNKLSLTNGIQDIPYSFSCHVYITSSGTSQGGTIFGKNADNSSNAFTNSEYRLNVTTDLSTLEFTKFSEGRDVNYVRYRFTNPPINQWFHLVITDDAMGDVKIYINSVEQYKTVVIGGTGYVKSSITASARWGLFNALGTPSSSRFLEGGIDDLGKFDNYVLTQEDIDWIYNGGNPRRLM